MVACFNICFLFNYIDIQYIGCPRKIKSPMGLVGFIGHQYSRISFGKRYDNSYSRYDNHDHGYSQSYDNFLDEQDDYDIMDDDF